MKLATQDSNKAWSFNLPLYDHINATGTVVKITDGFSVFTTISGNYKIARYDPAYSIYQVFQFKLDELENLPTELNRKINNRIQELTKQIDALKRISKKIDLIIEPVTLLS